MRSSRHRACFSRRSRIASGCLKARRGQVLLRQQDAAANVVVVGGSELFVDVMREPGAIYCGPGVRGLHPVAAKGRPVKQGLAGFSPS